MYKILYHKHFLPEGQKFHCQGCIEKALEVGWREMPYPPKVEEKPKKRGREKREK